MKLSNARLAITLGVLVLVLGTLALFVLQSHKTTLAPESNPSLLQTQKQPLFLKKKTTVVWGKVTNKQGNALGNILVVIADQGTTTDQDGNYIVAVSKDLPQANIRFTNLATGEQYQRADSFEQSIYLTPGKNNHYDFTVEKVAAPTK